MWEGGKTVNVHGMRPMGQDLPLKQTGCLLKRPSEPWGQDVKNDYVKTNR